MSFKVNRDAICPSLGLSSRAGARVTFEGVVRCHNEGRKVMRLEYEAFTELAVQVGDEILEEAKSNYDVFEMACAHRTGELEIGETAVKIEATAEHRQAAFDACQYVIEELKRRVPIWKREVYADGKGEWLNAEPFAEAEELTETERRFYGRQMVIPWVGDEGQSRIKKSSVLVIGAGGLGCPAIQYLVGAGVGRVVVCDHDIVDATNLHRQPLFDVRDIGRNKVHVVAEKMRLHNPYVVIETIARPFTQSNSCELIANADVVLDCTDDMHTKFAISDACVMNRVAFVQASVFQTEGQISTWLPETNGGCLRCQWPKEKATLQAATCKEVGALGPVPGVLGTLQAWEALRIIVNGKSALSESLYLFDLSRMDGMKVNRPVRKACPVCSGTKTEDAKDVAVFVTSREELAKWTVVDIRENANRLAIEMPLCDAVMSEQELIAFDWERPPLLVCEKGVNGLLMASRLRASGKNQTSSLIGGLRTLEAIARKQPH